jgi:ribosomal protein S27AE
MSAVTNKMICPRCGTPMNQHAEKLVEASSPPDAVDADPDLGGVIHETHACPKCGNVEFRRARWRSG